MANLFKRASASRTEEENVDEVLHNWNPPKVSTNQIYERRGIFEWNPDYEIKRVENTVSIQGEYGDFQLFNHNDIRVHMNNYKYLDMGLIQVAVKPLTRNGCNNSVLVALRDDRYLRFDPSLLAIAESSLNNGPIYFNCYPQFLLPLHDSFNVLTLNVKLQGSLRDVAVVYRVCYKVLNTFETKVRVPPEIDRSTFIETNLLTNEVAIRRTVARDSIQFPDRWTARSQTHNDE